MKRTTSWNLILAAMSMSSVLAAQARAEGGHEIAQWRLADTTAAEANPAPAPGSVIVPEAPTLLHQSTMSGPRVGFTFALGDGETARELRAHGMGRMVSQFGWHFERQVAPIGGGPVLLTEAVPLIGGLEYGKVIPSVTFALGARFPSGLEFGIGPSLTLANSAGKSNAGLVVAVGKSMNYGGLNIPFNLAISTNSKGTRTTFSTGYAIRR